MSESQSESASLEDISVHAERIADELHLLRTILDEIRSDLQWAIQNGRLEVNIMSQMPSTEEHASPTKPSQPSAARVPPPVRPKHDATLF